MLQWDPGYSYHVEWLYLSEVLFSLIQLWFLVQIVTLRYQTPELLLVATHFFLPVPIWFVVHIQMASGNS